MVALADPKTSLGLFSRATQMLAEADTIQKAKELRNLALSAADWARRRGLGNEAIQYARSYALEAERKMGEMLAATPRAKGAAGIGPIAVTRGNHNAPTLAELGLTKRESSDAQLLASIPLETFAAVKTGETTLLGVRRAKKEEERQQARASDIAAVRAAPDAASLVGVFATMVIDPPWDWEDEGDVDQFGRARPTYTPMSFEQLAALPFAEKASPNSHCYLWVTNRSLPKGFTLLAAWGFRYISCLTWCKPSIGMGNYFRGSTEQVLFGVHGSLPLSRHDVGTWFTAPRGAVHSAKPDEFYSLVESCSPGPYLDAFGRKKRAGWTMWGSTP